MNFFRKKTLDLWKMYTNTHRYSHRFILKELILLSLETEGVLPNTFDMSMDYPDIHIFREVLHDLGYSQKKINVSLHGNNVHVIL